MHGYCSGGRIRDEKFKNLGIFRYFSSSGLKKYASDIFETWVTVTPQSKFELFQNFLKILNLCLGGDNVYFLGDNGYFGEIKLTLGDSRRF